MTRGNWQKRVETAEARKTSAKQKKQRSEEKRLAKVWFQELLQQFDRYNDEIYKQGDNGESMVLHLWTDAVPSLSEHLVDLLEDDPAAKGKGGGGKPHRRGENKGRPRSDSNADNKNRKKAHPRSKSAVSSSSSTNAVEEHAETTPPLLLCRDAFFKGPKSPCCAGGKGKKSSTACRYIHYSPRFKTLCAIVGDSLDDKQWQAMEKSLIDATLPDIVDSEPGAMEFLYHTTIALPKQATTTAGSIISSSDETIASFVTEKLVENDTPSSSVFYAALNGVLVFDRLGGGVVLDEREFVSCISKKPLQLLDRRRSSVGSQEESTEQGTAALHVFHHLPSTILEHILLFLPDVTVGAAALVCRAWHDEIGKHSPNLWLELLKRRKWPVPVDKGGNSTGDERIMYRAAFLEHYTVLRDLRALAVAVNAIMAKSSIPETEVAFQDYTRRKYTPTPSDECISVHGWSDRLVLAGYAKECSLRLFEATALGETGELRCKELVCQSVSPYQNTKKRSCRLTAVDIDEQSIGCLCAVSSDRVPQREADVLVILRRDEFLLGSSSDANNRAAAIQPDAMKVIDIGEAVLNYLLTSEVADHRLLPLFDHLNDGGKIGEIDVRASEGSMCACGYGRFLVEVSISIYDLDAEDEGEMIHLDRKLMLFSSNFNAIVWMGESYAPHLQAHPSREKVQLALSRQHTTCFIASKSCHSPEIIMTEIDARGGVSASQFLEASSQARRAIAEEDYDFSDTDGLVVTRADVIAVEVMLNRVNDELNNVQSVLLFYPRYPDTNQAVFDAVRLPRGYLVKRLDSFFDQYVIVFCQLVRPIDERANDADDLEGQWFSNSDISDHSKTVAVVVDIESRCMVGQVDFFTEVSLHAGCFGNGTTGLAIGSRGLAITGSNARSIRQFSPVFQTDRNNPPSKKKKKSIKGKRSGKKDGFARGMSLRG